MKTNREWLMMMDEPERSQAIENAEKQYPEWLNDDEGSIYRTLCRSFSWDKTPKEQGWYYWNNIAEKYRNR